LCCFLQAACWRGWRHRPPGVRADAVREHCAWHQPAQEPLPAVPLLHGADWPVHEVGCCHMVMLFVLHFNCMQIARAPACIQIVLNMACKAERNGAAATTG
jgi:hypothetical protein